MATSKTLTPTNVTISIPEMTDSPDASVFSNCIDKEADAINALNNKIRTITSGSLHDIKTSGVYYLTGAVTDKPIASGGLYVVSAYSNSVLVGVYADLTYGNQYTVTYDGTNWNVNSLISKIVTASLNYDAANAVFPLGNNPAPGGGAQITVPARNVNTGALYILWFKSVQNGFAIGSVLSGSAPSNNDMVFLQYFA